MTSDELEEFVARHPLLFHMAERGSWPSIREYGLLSTSALLDLYEYRGAVRKGLESQRRSSSQTITHPAIGQAVIRDQKPITDSGLRRCLLDGLTPFDWYRILNCRIFFWVTEKRLHTLLNAGSYADSSHDVLFVDTRSLIENYSDVVTLAPMNTGNTKPYPHPRGRATFSRIHDYPYSHWMRKRRGREPIVELAVLGGIPDIERFTFEVKEMHGSTVVRTIWIKS